MVGQRLDRLSVMLVEDEDLYRDLLRLVLSQHPRLNVVGAFAEAEAALAAAPRLHPDVAVLDIELRGELNGIQLGLRLREQFRDIGIVLLSNHRDVQFLAALPTRVVSGWSYLLKRSVSDVESLARAVEGAANRLVVLDPQLVSDMRPRAESRVARLTQRQAEILALIAQGYTNAGIAEKLVLTEKSVENQINVLYQQIGIDRSNPAIQPRVTAVLTYLNESRTST